MHPCFQDLFATIEHRQLVKAIETNLFDFWAYLGQSSLVDLYDGPDMLQFQCDIPSPICNSVFRAKLHADEVDRKIYATIASFQSRGLPLRWMISPSTQPVNLDGYLKNHGFTHNGYSTGMAVNLHELNETLKTPADLTIQIVQDEQTLEKMMQTFTRGYGIPESVGNLIQHILRDLGFELPLRHYVGFLHGKPVACSSLLLSSGIAGVFLVATVEQARGQGIGSALTLKPLLDARNLGYHIGILGATEMGAGVYHRLGFRDYFKFEIYIKSL